MLLRLVWKFLPYLVVAVASFLLIGGVSGALGEERVAPTSVGAGDLWRSAPTDDWLKITGGGYFWPEFRRYFEGSEAGKNKTLGYFVPIASPEDAQRWLEADRRGEKRPDARRIVLRWFGTDEFLKAYPQLAAGDASNASYVVEDIEASVASPVLWPKALNDFVRTELALTPEQVTVVKCGRRPATKGESATLAAFAAVALFGGVAWVKRRRRQAREESGGFSGGVASAVADGLRAARKAHALAQRSD
jgi:hypothetical protein